MSEMSREEMLTLLNKLQSENHALRTASQAKLKLAISEKGAVMLTGLRRFPVTFYADEWKRILDQGVAIRAFIDANKASLSVKTA